MATIHPRMHPQEFMIESSLSVSDEEEQIYEEDALELEDEDFEDTRLRYQRLQARGRAAELAFNNRMQREREEAARARSRSKSRSRPGTPILGSLFKRDNLLPLTRSQSPPVSSVEKDKSSRRPSVTNLFKLKPLSRSSSSKSIYNPASTSSSQATSPFPSPLTPLSPLPFFLSPKTRRKAIPNPGEDIEAFGSPLARTPRRPSPTRAMTLPMENTLGLQPRGANPPRHRDSGPLRHDPATGPHLTYAQ